MEIIEAYKCKDGHLETDKDRAIAWDLVYIAKKGSSIRGEPISFTGALWIIENRDIIMQYLKEMDEPE